MAIKWVIITRLFVCVDACHRLSHAIKTEITPRRLWRVRFMTRSKITLLFIYEFVECRDDWLNEALASRQINILMVWPHVWMTSHLVQSCRRHVSASQFIRCVFFVNRIEEIIHSLHCFELWFRWTTFGIVGYANRYLIWRQIHLFDWNSIQIK